MSDLEVLIADGNSPAARRARVKLQPRDRKGRWIPTGASIIAAIRGLGKKPGRDSKGRWNDDARGSVKKYKLKAIGGTATKKGEKNKIRALLTEDAPELGLRKNTVVEIDPANGELDTQIKLDRDFLERKGIDPDLQHTLPSTLGEKFDKVEDINPKPADDLDIELATNGLNDDEDKDFRKEREQEPLAKLPPGMEELSKDELDALTRGGPKAPSDVKKPAGKPPRFPGDKGVPEPTDVSDKPKPPTLVDHRDSILQDAMSDAFYGGNPDIDDVLRSAEEAEPEEVGISDLKPGDVIALGGGPKVVTRVEKKTRLDGSEGYNLYVDQSGREAKVNPGGQLLPGSAGVVRIRKAEDAPKKPVTQKPEKPEAARKPPPKKPTPEKPTPEKPKPVPKKAPKAENVAKKSRKDDGKPIKPSSKSREELYEKKINNIVDEDGKLLKVTKDNGKEAVIEDPNAIVNALLEENPNAKIKENGAIVLERGSFTDTDGKKYNYEVSVERTVGNQFMERYTISDPKTGEALYDFYNADYKDSFRGLYGKSSGLTKTRDYLLGKDAPGGGLDKDGIPAGKNRKELSTYFGPDKTIENRLKYLRKGKDPKNWRLLTIDENYDKFLEGRDRELNKSDQADGKNYKSQFGNVKRSFIGSIYEAIELDDMELLKERLVQALGRSPDNEESINKIIDRLKAGIDERYKGTPRHKQLAFLPLHMQKFLEDEQADLRARSNVPFISEDGVTRVVPGDRVRFINNEGDMVVGEVVKLNAGSGVNGGYKDTARVKFGNQIVDNLQTRNMLHTDEEITDYAQWVRGDEKLKRRAEELGIDFEEYKRRKEDNPDFNPDDPEESTSDAGAPYIPESESEGEEAETPEASEQPEAPAPQNTRIKSGKVSRENSNLAARINNQAANTFIESGEEENEEYVRVESRSRKERAALKPTPQAVELKDQLVSEGKEVVDGLQNSEEYKAKLEELKKNREDYKKGETEFGQKLREYRKALDEAEKNLKDAQKAAEEGIEDPDELDPLRRRFRMLADFTGHPEVQDAFDKYKAASKDYSDFADSRVEYVSMWNREKELTSDLAVLSRNYVKAELEKQGVEFGGYTSKDLVDRGALVFTGPRKAKDVSAPNDRAVQRKYEAQFDEILSNIPKGVIESIFFGKTSTRGVPGRDGAPPQITEEIIPLRVGIGRTRGHYSPSRHYTVLNEKTVGGRDNSIVDVGIHELWHAAQTNNADISALEHAWTYGRAMGSTSVQMPAAGPRRGYGSDERFIDFQTPTPHFYTQKTYDTGNVMFGRNDGASEVSTTLMQGLFSNLKYLGIEPSDSRYDLDVDALAFAIGLLLGSGK